MLTQTPSRVLPASVIRLIPGMLWANSSIIESSDKSVIKAAKDNKNIVLGLILFWIYMYPIVAETKPSIPVRDPVAIIRSAEMMSSIVEKKFMILLGW